MQVDLLIEAGWIIPVEPVSVIHHNYSLVIDQGRILDLLARDEAALKYQPRLVEKRHQHVLIPGLINCHTHAAMSLLAGFADDLPLMEWLQNHIWPADQRWVSENFVRDGTDLAMAQMLMSGTTCFNDMYFFPEVVAQQAIQAGMRANIGLIVFDFPTAWAAQPDEYLSKGLALHQQLRHQPLLSCSFAPHAPYTVSDQPLQKVQTFADELDLTVHMHVHETAFEVADQTAKTGISPLKRLQSLGLLTPSFMAVHMTQLTAAEVALVAASGAHVVHCPESNLKLASGFCPVAQCLEAGINVALGTDGSASNNDLDMWGEMRTAALLAKVVAGDAAALNAATALQMATLNGAKALGLAAETGSLVRGKAADVVAVDVSGIEAQPLFNPLSHLVYAASRQQVSDVWVAGRQLLKQRQLTSLDLESIRLRSLNWQRKLQASA